MTIRYRDLTIPKGEVRFKYLDAIERVYDHGKFILGPEVEELEARLANISRRSFCRSVNSGTFALTATLLYLRKRYGSERDEVILPAISWVATAQAVIAAGLKPVFADTNSDFFISTSRVEELICKKTLCVVAVDFTGYVSSDYADLVDLCRAYSVELIQDSAQSFGANTTINDAFYSSCGIGYASVLSINSMKLLPSHGEGGAVLTDDIELAQFVERFRYQGCVDRIPLEYGVNGRMETIQAAIALVSLEYYEQWIYMRRLIADRYYQGLADIRGVYMKKFDRSIFHTYYSLQIGVERREKLCSMLKDSCVEYQLQYPYILSDLSFLSHFKASDMQVSRRITATSLCLPCHEKLLPQDIEKVISIVREFTSEVF